MNYIYWTSTLAISGFLLLSSYTYFFSESTINGLKELGFPNFFRIQLGVLKIIGAIILLLPKAPLYLKEWAYAGAGFFLLTALVAHIAHRDSVMITILLLVLFATLAVSRYQL
ncbi:MAG: DoxX family protein [Bacteroidota bacterium]